MRNNLKEFRRKLGLSQEEMGAMFNLTRQQWCNIESGQRKGSGEFWVRLQKKFGLTADETLKLMEVS